LAAAKDTNMTDRLFSRSRFTALGIGLLMMLAGAATPETQGSSNQAGGKFRRVPNAAAGRYVVVLNDWAAGPVGDGAAVGVVSRVLAQLFGGNVDRVYQHALLGFAVRMPEAAARLLSLDDRVAFVEEDGLVHALATQSNPPSWGLDRIDQRNLPLNQSYTYNFDGTGVTAYIIDTGIRFSHNDFGGRASSGFDAIDGGAADDCNGHGTHVAGTVGGAAYGVAKNVSLVAVRVLNCQGSGTNSQVIAGIDWVTGHHQAGQPAVANMSLGGGANTALDNAVRNSIADGVTYALAAGNENTNACTRSPARTAEGITVGATTSSDARASYSNFGTCLDLFAPGSGITSAWSTSNTATNTISGTSMATPHVAGVAALYLDEHPSAAPQEVRDAIVNSATQGVVTGAGSGSPNRLLYSLLTTAPPPPPPPPPPGCGGTLHSGSLSGPGDSDVHPNGTYFQSIAGTHRGTLDGPAGVDFDLYLYRWNGFFWSVVASGTSSAPDELVVYNGTAGYYYWRVTSYAGAGAYTFCLQRPTT
jgi:subtilisin family serine protease